MTTAAVGLAIAALVFVLWAAGVFLAFLNGYWLSVALPLATSVPLLMGHTGARFLVERFGLPNPRSDDAARALTTAESLYTSVTAWLADLPPAARDRLDFRIGVHFGPAIMSRLGSPTHQQITAAGDTINVASRLLEVAKQQHCRVLVTEDLLASARAALPLADVAAAIYAPLTVPIRGRTSSLNIRVRN